MTEDFSPETIEAKEAQIKKEAKEAHQKEKN